MLRKPLLFIVNFCAYALSLWTLIGLYDSQTHFSDSFSLVGPMEWQVIKRLTSPVMPNTRFRYDAVLMSGNGGATVPSQLRLYIVPKGVAVQPEEQAEGYPFQSLQQKDLSFRWAQPRLLEISYREAKIHYFSNYWQPPLGKGSVVEIRLKPLQSPWSLSADDRNVSR